jgi:Tol biopolymer transport system component/tRNA A-37 threonylcarbamoyl transferase component Bud32
MDSISELTELLSAQYTIEEEIGAGGMARVYLAQDRRHGRRVAIKVLNPELAALLGVERFLSEIKVTASLHHPNLLPLYDSGEVGGRLFYVMPFVESGSLRVRLEREKHLPVEDAVRIALGVASALQYAHKQGVIHRDLKPENILLHEGEPLVADFGIALAVKRAGGERFTQTGMSLGTPQYSSPEQAMGERVIDGRSDIYSLGTVLYEMLAGDPPHQASTLQAVVAKVITERPKDIRLVRPSCPEHVAQTIDICLAKLAADRFASAHEFCESLKGHSSSRTPPGYRPGSIDTPAVRARSRRKATIVTAAVGLGAALLTAAAMQMSGGRDATHERAVRFALTIDPDETIATGVSGTPLALSPDGGALAYLATGVDGVQQMHLRSINDSHARTIPGTLRALHPAFSPDGRAIAFMRGSQLDRVDVASPATRATVATMSDTIYGLAWGQESFVLGRMRGGLLTVPVSGGAPRPLTTVDTANGENSHRWPVMLADGKAALFTIWKGRNASARLALVSLDDGEVTRLEIAGAAALGVADDQLVYADSTGRVMAIPFSLRRRATTGQAISGEQTSVSLPGAVKAALSSSGTLVFSVQQAASLEMVLVDTSGRVQPLLNERARFADPRFSPDGSKIAVTVGSDTTADIYIVDPRTRRRERLTTQSGNKNRPEWTADGARVIYRKTGSVGSEIWGRRADKGLQAERVVAADREAAQGLPTRDGKALIYRTDSESRYGMHLWLLDTTVKDQPRMIASGRAPAVSPDTRWLAFSASPTGTLEVYLRDLAADDKTAAFCQISDEGGSEPAWARDGKRLFYRNGRQMMAATLSPATAGCPSVTRRPLFELPAYTSEFHRQYDVAPDGSGFVMLREYSRDSRVEVVHNWLIELRSRIARSAAK